MYWDLVHSCLLLTIYKYIRLTLPKLACYFIYPKHSINDEVVLEAYNHCCFLACLVEYFPVICLLLEYMNSNLLGYNFLSHSISYERLESLWFVSAALHSLVWLVLNKICKGYHIVSSRLVASWLISLKPDNLNVSFRLVVSCLEAFFSLGW